MFRVVRVSGTIRKAEEAVIRQAQVEMRRARQEAGEEVGNAEPGILGLRDNPSKRKVEKPSHDDDVQGIEDDDIDMSDEDHDDRNFGG